MQCHTIPHYACSRLLAILLLRKRKDTDRQKQGSVGAHLREQLLLESTNLDGRERQDGTELPGPFTIQVHAPPSGAHTRGIDRARAGIPQGPDACRWGPDGRRETERRSGKFELRLHWLLFYDKEMHPLPMRGIRSPALADFRPLV